MLPETILGPAIVAHLNAWLANEFGDRLPEGLRDRMLQAAVNDFDWLDRSWWKLYDHLQQH